MSKVALIIGVTGQDGAYLSEFLIEKGYIVHGIKRRSSYFNTQRVDHLFKDIHKKDKNFILHFGDLSDSANMVKVINDVQPDEIYNLGAMSHVKVSFEIPEYTSDINAIGTLRILEAIRILKLNKKVKFYQASSSELYGLVQETPQSETTPFYPRSPYAVAKLYSYWISKNYREAYGIFACNGVLFNHESPMRGETFVTRKITRGIAKIVLGIEDKLYLGNLYAKRDWGHAKDYVEAMWLILQYKKADDWVIATGINTTVKDFVIMAFEELGITIKFEGRGIEEYGYITNCKNDNYKLEIGKKVIEIDPNYFRKTEVDTLLGDPTKAKTKLKWKPKYDLKALIKDMVISDFELIKKKL